MANTDLLRTLKGQLPDLETEVSQLKTQSDYHYQLYRENARQQQQASDVLHTLTSLIHTLEAAPSD